MSRWMDDLPHPLSTSRVQKEVAIVEPFKAKEEMVKVIMFAMRTLFHFTFPWSLNKQVKPLTKEEKLPSLKVGKFVHVCTIFIQQDFL